MLKSKSPSTQTMVLQAYAKTNVGLVRSNNEDDFYINQDAGIIVIADGMGGHASGEVASKMAVDIISNVFEKSYLQTGKYSAYVLDEAIQQANKMIYLEAKTHPQHRGMGTTIAAVCLHDNQIRIAHVGDSRVYLFRSGNLKQLTNDHTIVAEQVRQGLLSKKDGEKSDLRNFLTMVAGQHEQINIDISERSVMDNDVILLCTDGLYEMVEHRVIRAILSQTKTDLDRTCNDLIEMAILRGGRDNITVIAALIQMPIADDANLVREGS